MAAEVLDLYELLFVTDVQLYRHGFYPGVRGCILQCQISVILWYNPVVVEAKKPKELHKSQQTVKTRLSWVLFIIILSKSTEICGKMPISQGPIIPPWLSWMSWW